MKPLALPKILRHVINHPLNRQQKLKAVIRFARWQIGSRLVIGTVVVPFVEGSRLVVRSGMTGATGNIYTGLHEFEDMAFVLHLLREGDGFIDVGANVGSYTVLASAVAGAKSIAIEPVPQTFTHLQDNINLNGIQEIVQCLNCGVSSESGFLKFTASLDTVNRVVRAEEAGVETIDVPVKSLDEIAEGFSPLLIKIDVEGFESAVIAGAERTLRDESVVAVVMELNGAGERYGFDELKLHEHMLDYGFSPYSYLPFERNLVALESKNTAAENTIYLRNIGLVTERIKSAPRIHVHSVQV